MTKVFAMSYSNGLTVAVLQAEGVGADVEANFRLIREAARDAAAQGAQLLMTPEMYLTGYNVGAQLADVVRDELVDGIRDIARSEGIALLVGTGLPAAAGISNSALLVSEDGDVAARYDKTHLFGDLDVSLFEPGDALGPIVELHGVRIGLLICYDVEFPETVRALASAGADLVLVPTAQMAPYQFIAEHVIRTRAWENQVYVAYANRIGSEKELDYVGLSSIVDPSGRVLAAAGPEERALLLARIDPAEVRSAQARNPYLRDRRPGLVVAPDPQGAGMTPGIRTRITTERDSS